MYSQNREPRSKRDVATVPECRHQGKGENKEKGSHPCYLQGGPQSVDNNYQGVWQKYKIIACDPVNQNFHFKKNPKCEKSFSNLFLFLFFIVLLVLPINPTPMEARGPGSLSVSVIGAKSHEGTEQTSSERMNLRKQKDNDQVKMIYLLLSFSHISRNNLLSILPENPETQI